MGSVEDGLEMQVASRGRTCGANLRDDFAHLDGVPLLDGDPFEVVVRGDQPVSVIDLHPVTAAPGMPANGPDHTGVGRINAGAACGSEVLAPVELSRSASQWAHPKAEARGFIQHFEGRH
jgi:hypothetical protein